MSGRTFFRSFAWRWCIALLLHELVVRTPALSNAVAALFSPGAHTPWLSLMLATGFLVVRVYVVLLWPAAVASLVRLASATPAANTNPAVSAAAPIPPTRRQSSQAPRWPASRDPGPRKRTPSSTRP